MPRERRNVIGNDDKVPNVLSKGVLVSVSIRCWGASARLDLSEFGSDIPKEIVRGMYDLIEDKSLLKAIEGIRGDVKRFLYRNSIPFPVNGLVFVSRSAITKIDGYCKAKKTEFDELVDEFVGRYSGYVGTFEEKYPNLYEAKKYPSVAMLKGKFSFTWAFRHFTVPDKEISVLSPELYEEEVSKFKAEIREMSDIAISTLGNTFIKKIEKLKEQCRDGHINKATVDGVNKFLEKFSDLWNDVVDHDELKGMIEKCKDYLEGVDADVIKADDNFRHLLGTKIEEITDEYMSSKDTRLTRRLDL